ncbi:MAG: hypothetical protein ACOC1P_06080, partial [Minisyncoccales bacterium]
VNVTGFSNYSVQEAFFCGDGICNEEENCSNCPKDCGTCSTEGSGGGGGGGGSSIEVSDSEEDDEIPLPEEDSDNPDKDNDSEKNDSKSNNFKEFAKDTFGFIILTVLFLLIIAIGVIVWFYSKKALESKNYFK